MNHELRIRQFPFIGASSSQFIAVDYLRNVIKKKILRWFIVLSSVYCLVGVFIYQFQNYFLFQRVALPGDHKYDFSYPHREINLAFNKESNINIVQFLVSESTKKGVVLYFHGNKRNIEWYAKSVPQFTKQNFEVWMIDYPGFGKSTGELTENILYAYAIQLYKLALKQFDSSEIIIYGRSMGCGIAAYLASIRPCKALLLETPYYSLSSVTSHFFPIYPMDLMTRIKLPAYEYISNVRAPITIFHGTNDWVIPLRNSKKLIPFLKPNDEFVIIQNGSHNDLGRFAEFTERLDSVLAK